jgi:hypothetical protein
VLAVAADGTSAYGLDGALRYRLELAPGTWLNAAGGRYAALCDGRTLVAVVDLATGVQRPSREGRCGDLLSGRWGR